MNNKKTLYIALLALLVWVQPVQAEHSELLDSMTEYMEFTEYRGGNILPEQIPVADWKKFHVIDTRRAEDYAVGHIPGAVNIEWRQLIEQRNKIPEDKPVIVYCNKGSVSAQGAFALKLLGYENIKILAGGFDGFQSKGGLQAYERATSPQF